MFFASSSVIQLSFIFDLECANICYQLGFMKAPEELHESNARADQRSKTTVVSKNAMVLEVKEYFSK